MAKSKVQRIQERVNAMKGDLRYWIGDYALKAGWTFERILEHRSHHWENPHWAKFPQWAKEQFSTSFDMYLSKVEHQLVWTHVLDGERVCCDDKRTQGRAREICEQMDALKAEGKANSAFCYAYSVSGRLVLLPFREDDRILELESGRLTDFDIQSVITVGSTFLPKSSRGNGTTYLQTTIPVQVEGNKVVQLLDLAIEAAGNVCHCDTEIEKETGMGPSENNAKNSYGEPVWRDEVCVFCRIRMFPKG